MSSSQFEQYITDLNFSFLNKKNKKSGILFTHDFEKITLNHVSPDVLFSLEIAKTKFRADAVFFRYFKDGRGFVPQLYLFDYTNENLSGAEKNRIHIQMWNGYQVPAYIIIEKSSVSIFDSRKRPKEEKDKYAKEVLTITGEAIKQFDANVFDTGIFWDEQNEKKNFRFEESATRDLIRGLKEIFRSFIDKSNLNRHVALKLLVQSLLIKYLEERDEKSASGYFAGTYFKKNFQCSNFCETIRKGKLLDLLDQLAKDFNGKIFEWDKKKEAKERRAIQRTEVQNLADYLDGNIKNSQYVIWRLYSFSHLPVEVISSVYEELLTDSKDIVYTPEMIVGTLVDECMPLNNPNQNFKIIDVSCGSGIFLVKTFKRMVQWWRYEQWKKTGELVKPSLPVLKRLLLENIYGVDIEEDAIRLSVFSLALAILDEVDLDPPTWGQLKFPDLSKNIIVKDFFEFIMSKPKANFDLVIGNPPFNPPKNELGQKVSNGEYFKSLKQEYEYQSEVPIPKQNVALHFLLQSFKILKKDGLLCLVQPSGPLIYHSNSKFKQHLFNRHNLLQVIDFTLLADKLWGRKNVATAAIFIEKSPPKDNQILHLIARRGFSNKNKLFLEFDSYDFNFITYQQALYSDSIWKANLLGGGRIPNLLEKLASLDTLGDFIEDKKLLGWGVGVGFQVKGEKNRADYITGKYYIPAEALTETGIDYSQKRICEIVNFDRPRKKETYTPPNILIRQIIGKKKIPMVLNEEWLSFPRGIVSIYAPCNEKEELKELFSYLIEFNSLLRFFLIATSGRALIGKATAITKSDLMSLPYSKELVLSETEKLLLRDITNPLIGKEHLAHEFNTNQVKLFSETFCKTLNSVYQNSKIFQLFKTIDAGKFIALHFEYTSEAIQPQTQNSSDIEEYIESVIPSKNKNSNNYHIQKIIKVYGQDSIILAKPKNLRYWLPSIALRDADETFADYFKSRYSNA